MRTSQHTDSKSVLVSTGAAITLGLFGQLVLGGHTVAVAASNCPAFTAGMIDAAALSLPLTPDVVTSEAQDNFGQLGQVISTRCELESGDLKFEVEVHFTGPVGMCAGSAFVEVTDLGVVIVQASASFTCEVAMATACRQEVVESFVWNQYCASGL